jgi:hypothetical protein
MPQQLDFVTLDVFGEFSLPLNPKGTGREIEETSSRWLFYFLTLRSLTKTSFLGAQYVEDFHFHLHSLSIPTVAPTFFLLPWMCSMSVRPSVAVICLLSSPQVCGR